MSSFYNTWRNSDRVTVASTTHGEITGDREERGREGNKSDSSFYNTWRNNWVIERRERGKQE